MTLTFKLTAAELMLIQINRATMIAEERGCTIDQNDDALSKVQEAYRGTKGYRP